MDYGEIMAVIEEHLPRLRGADPDQPIQESGLLDSFDYVTLVQVIEDSFGIRVTAEDMVDENFCSKNAIARFVEAKKQAGP